MDMVENITQEQVINDKSTALQWLDASTYTYVLTSNEDILYQRKRMEDVPLQAIDSNIAYLIFCGRKM